MLICFLTVNAMSWFDEVLNRLIYINDSTNKIIIPLEIKQAKVMFCTLL
jgi:hypothetical protein